MKKYYVSNYVVLKGENETDVLERYKKSLRYLNNSYVDHEIIEINKIDETKAKNKNISWVDCIKYI